ncbi:hypothetical protein PQR63_12180 [Herbaspirillum rhizosphaerae]|uniref:Uncharacterized protein n=1 Tax=Herbaspirillum rhizosphaerae TaxID=346179 RepID=A0ABW8Z7Y2_9BURK
MRISSSEFKTELREGMMGAWQHADGGIAWDAAFKKTYKRQTKIDSTADTNTARLMLFQAGRAAFPAQSILQELWNDLHYTQRIRVIRLIMPSPHPATPDASA